MAGARGCRRRCGAGACTGVLAAGLLGTGCGSSPKARTASACRATTWVTSWTAAPSDAQNAGLVDQTSRTVLTPHLGGETLRVHLSNRLGPGPVSFRAASIGLRRVGTTAALAPGSRRALSFAGGATVTVPAGAEVASDPVRLTHTASADLAVSLFAAGASGPATEHIVGQQTSYLTPPGSGDHTGEDGGGAFTLTTGARYFVSGVDVRAPVSLGGVVALGDSITDGFGGPPDGNDRYPDFLARRLAGANGQGRHLAVVNAGVSGNHLLSDARLQMGGPSALERLGTDVVGQAGVSDVIVLEGINDIAARASSTQVIAGLGEVVHRLHAAGLRIQLGTLTPFGGTVATAEAARLRVNAWIRGGGGADGTVDFDAAVRDPTRPERLTPGYDSGDHVHPSRDGRRAMADAVDLSRLRGATCRPG